MRLLFFLVALLAVVAMGRYYVLGVLERDRVASRWAAVGFLVFCAVAVVPCWGSYVRGSYGRPDNPGAGLSRDRGRFSGAQPHRQHWIHKDE